jgi:hypothetical protein
MHRFDDLLHRADAETRRDFVTGLAQRLLCLSAIPWLSGGAAAAARAPGATAGDDEIRLGPATARNVIYVFLRGGMSHLDTFDPKPGARTQGPITAIATAADGVQVSEHFPLLGRQMDKVALLSGMSSTQGAHAQGQYMIRTSYLLRGTIEHPSLGAWVHRMAGRINRTLPGHVVIGGGSGMPTAGFFPPQFAALPIGDPDAGLQNSSRPKGIDEPRFARRLELLAKMNEAFESRYGQRPVRGYSEAYADAVRLMHSSDLVAFDLAAEPDELKAGYGSSNFGQGLLLARRLVEHGVRFIEVVNDGWDTHNQNFDALEDKCPEIDRGLAALLADLDARGLLRETLVVLATEFGRTPDIVPERNGRNHHPQAFTCLLAGGGIKGGIRYGRTDAEGREVVDGKVSLTDFNATIAHALGLPLEHKLYSPSGRPFTVADKGQPVLALFA